MRHLLACLAILAAFNVKAQATTIWNPDANNDGIVGASDLLPFLEIFGNSFSAPALYCQDTSSFTASFLFDGIQGPNEFLTIEAPLAAIVFVMQEGMGQYDQADLILPADSVPNGYRCSVVNVNLFGQGGYGVDVLPNSDLITTTFVGRGRTRVFIHFDGIWYPTE